MQNFQDERAYSHVPNGLLQVSDRALKQVSDYVRAQRLEDGLFEMEPVAVRAVCNNVTSELERLFATKKRGLRVKYLNRAKLVNANSELLFSVVYNFLVNAMRYSHEGTETELLVKDHAGKVKVTVRDYLLIIVLN